MLLQKFRKLKGNIAKARKEHNKFIKKVAKFIKSPSELRPIKIRKNTQFDKILEAFCITRHQTKLISTTDFLSRPALLAAKPKKDKQFEYSFKNGSMTIAKANNLEDILVKGGIIKWIFGDLEFGNFMVPEVICEYVAESRRDDRIPDKGLPTNKALLDKAKNAYETILDKTEMDENIAFSLLGGLWCEMGWAFDTVIYNTAEQSGQGLETTAGYSNCGECWFGLTFWQTKSKIIAKLKSKYGDEFANVATVESEYVPGKMLCDYKDDDHQCKILDIFLKEFCGKHGKNMTGQGDDDLETQLYSSFLFKAAPAKDPNLDEVKDTVDDYIKQHEKDYKKNNPAYRAKNGFTTQIYAAIMLALYMENNEVPDLEEIDNLLGV